MGAEHRTEKMRAAHAKLHQAVHDESAKLEDERKLRDADVARRVPDDQLTPPS